MRKRQIAFALSGAAFLLPSGARAAGGPDVVDDAFAETPEVCHVESWFTGALRGGSLLHLGVGCTPAIAHRLELDAAIERQAAGGTSDFAIEPGIKYTLLALPGAFSLGIDAGTAFNRHGRLEGLSIIAPASITLGKYTALNLDLGWQRTRAPRSPTRDDLFWGIQLAQAFAPHFVAIAEIFGTAVERPGGQAGIRWSPGPEKVDIDLRGSHGPGHAGNAMTLGVTVRI